VNRHFVEVTNGSNWGKFSVITFDAEDAAYVSAITGNPLLRDLGWWDLNAFAWVLDLQTGEGAYFAVGGSAKADLTKHRIWVCPMFEPFLVWLYDHGLADLPPVVELPGAEGALYGYRRPGPEEEVVDST
jgi:hypothetical protein